MFKFSIQIILDIAQENIVKSLTSIFWIKSLEKNIVLCLREFACSLVKTLRVHFKGKRKLSPLKKLNRPHHQEDFQVQNKVLTLYKPGLFLKLYCENFQIFFLLNPFTLG